MPDENGNPRTNRNVKRDDRGRWLPGESPCPGGGGTGSGKASLASRLTKKDIDRVLVHLRGSLEDADKTIALDTARFIAASVLPRPRPVGASYRVEEAVQAPTLTEKALAVAQKMVAGELPAEDAQRMLAGLRSASELSDMAELRDEIKALRESLGK